MKALQRAQGDITRAASNVGKPRRAFFQLMKKCEREEQLGRYLLARDPAYAARRAAKAPSPKSPALRRSTKSRPREVAELLSFMH